MNTKRIKFVLDRIKKLIWVREMYIVGKRDTETIDYEIAVLRAEITQSASDADVV